MFMEFITTFFYLFSHVIVAFYYRTTIVRTYFFPRDSHERELTFERETDNPRDSNAIKVLGDDEWLGYIPKENRSV